MTEAIECVVIGAGVVGLATARALAQRGVDVLVVERHDSVGEETSSHNSGIIHAGLYYPQQSLKARLCMQGRDALYAYCAAKGIPHRRSGKLVVATGTAQVPRLQAIRTQAVRNGVNDLAWLTAGEVDRLEPRIRAVAGLWSPSTGIVDVQALMRALRTDLETAGGVIACNTPFLSATALTCATVATQAQAPAARAAASAGGGHHGFLIKAGSPDNPLELHSRLLINCAGLGAAQIARRVHCLGEEHVPQMWFAKGSYFELSDSGPFRNLIYPLPEHGGLGVHVTLDLAGRVRFGPDVQWIVGSLGNGPDALPAFNQRVDPGRAASFRDAIRDYWPDVDEHELRPGYAGIRPKLSAPDEPPADFMIQGPQTHGVAGLVNLYGIESPGLTACLAIGDEVAAMLA